VVAVIGGVMGAETTDYVVPFAVLQRSGVAEVWALSTTGAPVPLHPALAIRPRAGTAAFDRRFPDGADYVIVPAQHHVADPAVLAWIVAQRAKGATIVGICSGVRVLSRAGLLAHRAATGHWYVLDALRRENPTMRWIADRRYVADRGIVTTTGVSASLPVSLALVEAIGGRPLADSLARTLGVASWTPVHASGAFQRRSFLHAGIAMNAVQFWRRERFEIGIADGVDEIALAFAADAWSRTHRSRAVAVRASDVGASGSIGRDVVTRSGLVIVTDATARGTAMRLPDAPAGQVLDSALVGIEARFGVRTADLVALQLEYARRRGASSP
jgi:transcriptional regulator GlxA family with amidase domain